MFFKHQALYNDDAMPVAHVALAVEGAAWDNPDNIPLMLANTIIGNYDRSMAGGKLLPGRLQTAYAERPGCHSFQSFNTCYNDTGLWGIYTVCEHAMIWEAIELAQDTWCVLPVERGSRTLLSTFRNIVTLLQDANDVIHF